MGLNCIITSLLYSKHPDELKFVLVDPKMVEFSLYSAIDRQYLAKIPDGDSAVITDADKALDTLNSLCVEMDNRYELLRLAGVRGIEDYNARFCARTLNPELGHRYLPYIVIIVDEYADLVMTASKDIASSHMSHRPEGPCRRPPHDYCHTAPLHRHHHRQKSRQTSPTHRLQGHTGCRQRRLSSTVRCAAPHWPRRHAGHEQRHHRARPVRLLSTYPRGRGHMQPHRRAARLRQLLPPPRSAHRRARRGGAAADFAITDEFRRCAMYIATQDQASITMLQRKFEIGFNKAGRFMDPDAAARHRRPCQRC